MASPMLHPLHFSKDFSPLWIRDLLWENERSTTTSRSQCCRKWIHAPPCGVGLNFHRCRLHRDYSELQRLLVYVCKGCRLGGKPDFEGCKGRLLLFREETRKRVGRKRRLCSNTQNIFFSLAFYFVVVM